MSDPACTCTDAELIARVEGHELMPQLLRLLARGRPLAPDELAAATGEPLARVRAMLASQAGVEWDDQGRLVGFGITLRATPHRFVVDGHDLYTWCATDTLLFTVMLDQPAHVFSTCPASGQAIHLELSPAGASHIDPPETVVSQLFPTGEITDVRAMVCNHGHFFASVEAASAWLHAHPDDGRLLGVAGAFEVAREVCQTLGWAPRREGDR